MKQHNIKKINFLVLSILFSYSIIAEEQNFLTEQMPENTKITKSCCFITSGPRGPKGLPGENFFPTAYGTFRNSNPQTGLTTTTPLIFPEIDIDPVGMTLLATNDGITVQNTGTYTIVYKATYIAEKDEGTELFSVASIAITINGNLIADSDQTIESNVADIVLAGDPIRVVSSWVIDLKAGDVIGLQGPSLFNITATGKSNIPVLISVYRIR